MHLTEQTQWKESFPGIITSWFSNCKATNHIPSQGNSVIGEVVPVNHSQDGVSNWVGQFLGVEVVSAVSEPGLCKTVPGSQFGAVCTHACTYVQSPAGLI